MKHELLSKNLLTASPESVPSANNLELIPSSSILYPSYSLESNNWVKLKELPSPYSCDEALLLCQISEDEWSAWIPDHGEAVLKIEQFC
ncbi:hypothetical protein [Scytonema sp. NUACC26]|uniref:hypothetical protein n=1 Tax=Scytonema sp. NUACC26 TaxID=3140176 RepID=UPI0034DC86AE